MSATSNADKLIKYRKLIETSKAEKNSLEARLNVLQEQAKEKWGTDNIDELSQKQGSLQTELAELQASFETKLKQLEENYEWH